MSHHGNNPEKMKNFAKLNTYHVDTMTYFLKKLEAIPGWRWQPAGSHRRALRRRHERRATFTTTTAFRWCWWAGEDLQLKGNRHVKFPKGTPLANLMLGLMDRYGVQRGEVRRQHGGDRSADGVASRIVHLALSCSGLEPIYIGSRPWRTFQPWCPSWDPSGTSQRLLQARLSPSP